LVLPRDVLVAPTASIGEQIWYQFTKWRYSGNPTLFRRQTIRPTLAQQGSAG